MNDLVIPLQHLRTAGAAWAGLGLPARLAVLARARRLLARRADAVAATVRRAPADTMVAEILPLLEAIRFLERRAPALLAPRSLRSGRPLWLWGVGAAILRKPLGAVLVIGPGNYPLFLPGAHSVQALAAGNAVAWKPAPGGEAAATAVAAILAEAGLPEGVLHVLAASDGPAAVDAGFDRIVLTGSAETGVAVLIAAAASLTRCTMELSGCDAAFVLPGADLALVARSLAYALRLNGGATCIAPRRVFIARSEAPALERLLLALLPAIPDAATPPGIARRLAELAGAAEADGARLLAGGPGRPLIVADTTARMALLQADIFAPWLAIAPVHDMDQALRDDALCPYALGASVFGPPGPARALATRLRAGSVCINDVIVPTADPRLPFGGNGRSGFGRTRGADGLLEMTAATSISERMTRFRPHLAPARPKDAGRYAMLLRWLHG